MTIDEAKRVTAYCAAAYPGPPWAETSLLLWAKELQDLPFEAALAGARWMIQNKPNFPSVADVRAGAHRHMAATKAGADSRALLEAPAPCAEDQALARRALADMVEQLKAGLSAKGLAPTSGSSGKGARRP